MLGRSDQYFQDILKEPEVLRDSKCEEIVRKAWDYFKMSYEKKLNYWTENTKPSRWPQLLAALSYAEVRFWAKTNNSSIQRISSFRLYDKLCMLLAEIVIIMLPDCFLLGIAA